jgi:hypothetical protein
MSLPSAPADFVSLAAAIALYFSVSPDNGEGVGLWPTACLAEQVFSLSSSIISVAF